ncbi:MULTISPECIES: Si-specific NAD(P)(+) transhydrogenase [unclassified Oceanobacter]|jgi:NAD(P) transhydrogenase|uniref:Si-specific NAD(P)(+) transhydrogenase n=1 Tax=unclassified Oceanobacter TaxID=2620260 RepID=UPI0026E11E87|nr:MULTISPECIES: Si-specific NAD(P)(+) transhydrogenase [unclassified Oceanobacter]MDO6681138.1 Si-specific NAD(P)(+) transhydrogenase [Oceanobacter sp. 5_MG-2023]MDP2504290.1 Si-specific NAD(P)(+) transhydrogenase [Oceanobacter sp. 3_MG-2023]MDP2546728.1 Si-specific NAD(P)(+) transhydrogenase [Oceanobacter sp. 4_MG-2023]MDP2608532.1 Si-specific NAD(P)(+) transhydrogenase [Oceanobacter sp. 1_MG-2023]MDP2611706.1 Si-specific NAD(P)(+) transhydrogenase [Oceanobacter sp. 2_MG-2023]
MADYRYDVVIIGAGPAGEGAAMNAAKHGKKVAVIEDKKMVGGNCTHWGTIPSKALRHAVKQIIQFNTNNMFREIGEPRWFSFPQVLKSAEKVIGKQVKLRTEFYGRNRINVYTGKARFADANTVDVYQGDTSNTRLHADQIVVATGSSPWRPSSIDFNHPRIYDSDTILTLSHTPRTIIIYGAGVIGCEYASIFSGLGVKVDLIHPGDRLLNFLDDEISDALSYHLRDKGALIRHNEQFDSVESNDRFVTMIMASGKKVKADAFLWAAGRSGNTKNLGLENLGLEANSRGQIEVDKEYRTAVQNVYAIGDVIGWPALASAAYDQGRAAASVIACPSDFHYVDSVPTGIYTIPEISSVGKTERQLTEEKIPYEVGQAFFKNIARAQITAEGVGMLKLLFHRQTLEILGIHCFGDQAAEIVHIGQAIMNQKGEGNTMNYFINTTFNYPTMAEAYRVAALNGLNRL